LDFDLVRSCHGPVRIHLAGLPETADNRERMTLTALPHSNQRHRLRVLLRDLSVQPIPIMHELDFFLEVLDWLTKCADHEPDWADACLAILSGRDKDLKIWTYDREFRTTWRRPNGTAIPLAVR
jgi:predicted nucleic acid-binding protein